MLMIIYFRFKNYMSFANECSFTMLANKDSSHADDLIETKFGSLSKTRVIYGANASGKSSFISAVNFLSSYIFNSNLLLENMDIKVVPFKFRENCFGIPSEFSICFIRDSIKYLYEFSCTKEKVLYEKLDIYYSAKPTTIFERTNCNEYKFNLKDSKKLNEYREKNLPNKLFLVTSASWNYEKTKPVVDYLLNIVTTTLSMDSYSWKAYLDKIRSDNLIEDYKRFCLDILNNADISISDFKIDSKKIKDIEGSRNMTELVNAMAKGDPVKISGYENANVYYFSTYHDIAKNESVERYKLDLTEESLGTVQMFRYSALLYFVFREGRALFIDEIDKSLHPLLVEHLFKLFKNKAVNPHNAQLIATTHDTNLLNLKLFRRDDIWFTERNYETGSTEMYSLSDFSPRKEENIEKAYLLGRFGAIPFIKEN